MQLLPRDEKFFELLIEQTRIVREASNLLADGIAGESVTADSRSIASRVRELERKGDKAVRQIYRRLHKTFITPIDPEDMRKK